MTTPVRTALLTALVACATAAAAEPTPTPAPAQLTSFQLPLADGTTGTAIFLPAPNGQAWLTISSPAGQLSTWLLTTTTPRPVPTPPTPPPPTPPPLAASQLIIVSDGPATNTTWKSPAVAAALTARGITTSQYTIQQVADPATDDAALRWIGRSAGHALPWAALAANDGSIIWNGSPPIADSAWLALLSNPTGRPATPPTPKPTKPDRTSQPVPCNGPTCLVPQPKKGRRR